MHPEIGKMSKIKIVTIKEDTTEAQPHEIPEVGKDQKLAPKWKYPAQTTVTPYQEARESTM